MMEVQVGADRLRISLIRVAGQPRLQFILSEKHADWIGECVHWNPDSTRWMTSRPVFAAFCDLYPPKIDRYEAHTIIWFNGVEVDMTRLPRSAIDVLREEIRQDAEAHAKQVNALLGEIAAIRGKISRHRGY